MQEIEKLTLSTFRFRRTALCDEIAPKNSVFNTYTKVTLPESNASAYSAIPAY